MSVDSEEYDGEDLEEVTNVWIKELCDFPVSCNSADCWRHGIE